MPLTASQISDFNEQGFLIVENAITATQLAGLQVDFKRWVEESRQYQKAYGEIADGRARFDLEPGHSQTQPALRRVSSPQEVSEAFLAVMRDNKALDALAQLYGPNLKFNNAKINAKMPGAATQVKYHQDFVFEPHSNDDLATVLIFWMMWTPIMALWKLYLAAIKAPYMNIGMMVFSRVQLMTKLLKESNPKPSPVPARRAPLASCTPGPCMVRQPIF